MLRYDYFFSYKGVGGAWDTISAEEMKKRWQVYTEELYKIRS